MSEPVKPGPGGGLFASLRQMVATALEIAQVRLELLVTEIEQEKLRVFDGLLWAGLALMLMGVGVILLCGFIVVLLWDGYRLATLGVLTLLFLGAGGLLMWAARRRLHSPGGVLSTTLASSGKTVPGSMRAMAAGEGMSSSRSHELTWRRQQLVARSAELRLTLANQAQVLRAPLAAADTARAGVQWLRRHPYWAIGPGVLLIALRPARALRWTARLWWGWRTFKRAQRWLAASSARRL